MKKVYILDETNGTWLDPIVFESYSGSEIGICFNDKEGNLVLFLAKTKSFKIEYLKNLDFLKEKE